MFRFLDDTAYADLAFEASGKSLDELIERAAEAVTEAMVDRTTLSGDMPKTFEVAAGDPDLLLYRVLSELVFLKDVDRVLFKHIEAKCIKTGSGWKAVLNGSCDYIDPARHSLHNDVKAITLHHFELNETERGWQCKVVLDI